MLIYRFFVVIFFLFFNNILYAKSYPSIPNDIDTETICPKKEKFGHVVIVIDQTSQLDQAQKKFITNQVFSKEFYSKYEPFTKFSYILINDKKPTENDLIFSKCRPKDKNGFFDNATQVKIYNDEFFDNTSEISKKMFGSNNYSNNSLIYETIEWVLNAKELDFTDSQPVREIIIVSDLMQNSEKLNLYKLCSFKCPSFTEIIKNNSGFKNDMDKYFTQKQKKENSKISMSLIALDTCDTKKRDLDSLIEFWDNLFKYHELNVKEKKRQPWVTDKSNCKI